MHFSDMDPMNIPAPATVDEVVDACPFAVMTFVTQPALEEQGVATVSSSSNGSPSTLDQVSIIYTLWRNPADQDDPANFADPDDDQRNIHNLVPAVPLPEWMLARLRLMRYPSLWEAVMTTRRSEHLWQTPERILVEHVNHILTNAFREERVTSGLPGILDSPATEAQVRPAVVRVDGVDVPGLQLDFDAHVYGIAADLGDRILSAVVSRDYLPLVILEFESAAASRSR